MKTKKGVVLAMVLVVCFLMSAIALLLHSNSRDEMQIAGNSRRILQSKLAAISGINHFKALDIFYEQVRDQASVMGEDKVEVISETALGDKTFYKVEVNFCCDLGEKEFVVQSTGYYKNNGRVISTHVKRSLFKTVD